MQDAVAPVVVAVGAPNDAHHGEVLAERAGDGVDGAEATDGERDGARPDPAAARAGVPVGGVRRVELVAAPDEPHPAVPRLRLELVEQREVEVPRHREHVARPDLRQPPREVPPQRGLPRRGRSRGRRRGRRRVGGRRHRADRGVHVGGGGGGGGS
ncbi:hypothetical protein EE612_000403, partial [Oryza sativa]